MARGGGRVNKDWIVRDYENPDAIDANNLYYDSTTTIKEAIQITGATGNVREIDYFILDANDITWKYVTLTYLPINTEIQFTIMGGVPQAYNSDFILKNLNQISWSIADTLIGLENQLQAGDTIQIEYTRSL